MIYVLLTNGFEEIEALTPVDIMRRGELEVRTVSITGNLAVTGAHGITVTADMAIEEVEPDNMEMLILPGGPGHTELDSNEKVHELIDYAVEKEIYIAAICASPSIIGRKGLLKGKKATAFPGFEQYLYDAEVLKDKVVRDGKIITAKGAGASAEFGFMIVSVLSDEEKANKLRESMQY